MVVEKEKNEITINFGQHQLNVDGKLYFGGFLALFIHVTRSWSLISGEVGVTALLGVGGWGLRWTCFRNLINGAGCGGAE